ncbi:MAG: hypothetical protein Q9190_006901 [Brigantiaea leucoxantha]
MLVKKLLDDLNVVDPWMAELEDLLQDDSRDTSFLASTDTRCCHIQRLCLIIPPGEKEIGWEGRRGEWMLLSFDLSVHEQESSDAEARVTCLGPRPVPTVPGNPTVKAKVSFKREMMSVAISWSLSALYDGFVERASDPRAATLTRIDDERVEYHELCQDGGWAQIGVAIPLSQEETVPVTSVARVWLESPGVPAYFDRVWPPSVFDESTGL